MSEFGLGRHPEFDERSRAFSIMEIVHARMPRSYTWRCPVNLNQGPDGMCVGFAWAQELAARPVAVQGIGYETGKAFYRRAQQLDEWEGEEPTYVGTSVLAGAKAVMEAGHLKEYRWAFGESDLAVAVGYAGPAIIGVDWYDKMFSPGPDGYVRPFGSIVGGHAILVRGINVRLSRYLIHNSWGASWGGRGGAPAGCAWMDRGDMHMLLSAGGDACVPVKRA